MTDFETREADWLSLDEARARILRTALPLPVEEVSVSSALGRALSHDLTATATLPPRDNSAMDGYAVRGEDLHGASGESPVTLSVIGEARPGDTPARDVGRGEAMRIMTGAPVPPGADSIVRVEHTDAEAAASGRVRIFSDHDRGANVRPAGEDMRLDETILRSGTSVGPGQIGVLAAMGLASVSVRRRPRVAILTNGDELVGPEEFERVRRGNAIPDTNGPTLAAAVEAMGGASIRPGIARDHPESIRQHVERAFEADALVTVGGASMGAGDLFKRVLDDMGFELDFWRVRIRPGSPFSYGRLPRPGHAAPLPVFGLPGNPGSAFVTFQLLVRPFLLALAGHRHVFRPRVRAEAADGFAGKSELTHFFRVRLKDTDGALPRAFLTGPQGSGLVTSVGHADGLAVLPEGVGEVPPGGEVQVILVRDAPGWGLPRSSPG